MKFSFTAVDGTGRPIRGVLRAESEDDAREALLTDDVFPKSLTPTSDDENVTWNSRTRVKERLSDARGAQSPAVGSLVLAIQMQCLAGPDSVLGKSVRVALTDEDQLVIGNDSEDDATLLRPEELETAFVAGFPQRVLRVVKLNGEMFEFHGGWFLAHSAVKKIAKAMNRKD